MSTVSIGIMRDNDGDFTILATLNNNAGHLSAEKFSGMAHALCLTLAELTQEHVIVLDRQDVPDSVCVLEEFWS